MRVQRQDIWHRKPENGHPDQAYRVIRIQMDVVEELRDTPRDTWPQRDALPRALNFLGESYEELGWDDLARRAYFEELELRRAFEDRQALRSVLKALRTTLIRLKLYEEALPIAEEERRVSVELSAPGKYSVETANSAKYWITHILGELGRHEESARSAGESVAELREQKPIKKGAPPGYGLAHAQAEHARRLVVIGEYALACDAAAEAAAFWRQQPWEEAVRCYTALGELSILQLRLGRLDEARTSHTEGVRIIRQRAERKGEPEFLGHLAGVLNNHANRLRALGLDHEALAAAQESVDRYRALVANAEGRAVVMKTELRLAVALIGLGSRLHDLDRLDEALAANTEAITIARKYEHTSMGRTELARAWTNRASALLSRNADQEAVDAAAKAVELYEKPESLALARNTFGVAAARVGRLDEALAASLRSLAEYREWHAADPYEYAPLLADALTDHAIVRSKRGEHAEAQAAAAESVEMHRRLVAINPDRYTRELNRATTTANEVRTAPSGH
ncbi:tetratricopeptide repeat protein [Lentzea tibetensis]|uniref:Tetratricopeptide repeat protein n=1 Tax=Lentzea tibetensis TaxID=2591470 RepID=A0A563F184_9PSEU|nr:tetratricopeptide repeat protein [Lentzea tibetensis]TWP53720.1 tetratricopeptide repeat protein [Lentzea tibetensis]